MRSHGLTPLRAVVLAVLLLLLIWFAVFVAFGVGESEYQIKDIIPLTPEKTTPEK